MARRVRPTYNRGSAVRAGFRRRALPAQSRHAMKPILALFFAAFAATAAHADTVPAAKAAPVSRSGLPAGIVPRLMPRQLVDARLADCLDRVFHDNLDGGAGRGCASGDGGNLQQYTDRATFMAALAPGHIENAFDTVTPGMSGALEYAASGYEYMVFTQFNRDGGLYNGAGFVSTDRVDDAVTLFFLSGAPVHALGADLWPSDFSLRRADGTISIEIWLEDGTIETVAGGAGDFNGFVSASPIVMVIVDAPDVPPATPAESPDRWATLDNLVIGDVP